MDLRFLRLIGKGVLMPMYVVIWAVKVFSGNKETERHEFGTQPEAQHWMATNRPEGDSWALRAERRES